MGVSVVQTSIGWIVCGLLSSGCACAASGGCISMSEISIPGICYQQKLLEQLLQRFERNGKRIQGRGIIFQIGCGDGNMPFHCGANPEDATPTAMARIGDANTGQGSPKERMTRIDNRNSLLRSYYQVNRGSELIRVSQPRDCPQQS